jgi:MFS family permease
MWIVVGLSRNPYQLIAFLSIQAIFSALMVLSWTDFAVNFIPGYKRVRFIERLNWWNGFGAILATFASGYFLTNYGFVPFVFFIATIFGVLASLSALSLRNIYLPTIGQSKMGVKESLQELKKNRNFLVLLIARTFLEFSVNIAGPFFAVFVVKNLGGSTMDVAIISIISSIVHLLFYKPWGFVVDFVGRKVTMLSCILLISTYPLVYAMTPNVFFLYFFIIFGAIGWAGFDIATFAYFSDVAEKKNVFQLTALYNFSIKTFGIIANFLGGILAQNFGIFKVFIISFILRLASLIFFIGIEERTGYKEMVKFGTTHHPFHFVQESITIYSILFSTLRRDIIRRKEFFDRLKRFFTYILKKIGLA